MDGMVASGWVFRNIFCRRFHSIVTSVYHREEMRGSKWRLLNVWVGRMTRRCSLSDRRIFAGRGRKPSGWSVCEDGIFGTSVDTGLNLSNTQPIGSGLHPRSITHWHIHNTRTWSDTTCTGAQTRKIFNTIRKSSVGQGWAQSFHLPRHPLQRLWGSPSQSEMKRK